MAYARTSAGAIFAWGDNSRGQLGTESGQFSRVPVPVQLPGTVTATAISAGLITGYALGSDGAVYAWGDGISPPVLVGLPHGIAAAALIPEPVSESGYAGGGGRDHSNCTDDETTRTVEAQNDPVSIRVSFDAKWWGECNSEPSYSYFDVTVTGKYAAGRTMNSRGRFWLGQDSGGGQYYVECSPPEVRLACRGLPVSFQAFPG